MSPRDELAANIDELCRSPVNNPTYVDILKVAPHLDDTEAAEIIMQAAKTEQGYPFIGPPTIIRGAEHIYRLTTYDGVLLLRWVGCNRRRESYAWITARTPTCIADYEYTERVADYAEVNYGEFLEWDKSRCYVTFHLIDPENQDAGDFVRISREITAGFAMDLDAMIAQANRGYPVVQILENNLTAVVTGTFHTAEMIGPHQPVNVFNCHACGGGIQRSVCSFCQSKIQNKYFQCQFSDWPYPLPLGLMCVPNLRESFKLDPSNAIKAHYLEWARQIEYIEYGQPRERTRVIEIGDS